MALLTVTNLESHPVNTIGLNGIINGNWTRLEAIFAPLAAGAADIQIGWDSSAKKFSTRDMQATLAYSLTPAVSFTGGRTQKLSLTGNATLITSNLAAGRAVTVIIAADASIRTLAFPGTWVWIGGAAPANIAASKTGLLELWSTTTGDAGVLARWTVQP